MGKSLATYVHVDGTRYGPGDVVPADVAEKITNPDVWATAERSPLTEFTPEPIATGHQPWDPNRPPDNAPRPVWAEYARSVGVVDVTGQMSREDIMTVVDARGRRA